MDRYSGNSKLVFILAAIASVFVECSSSDEAAALLSSQLVAVADAITLLILVTNRKCGDRDNKDPKSSAHDWHG